MVEFETLVLPHIAPLMSVTDPIQILYIFLNNMELLMKKTPEERIQIDVLPMIYNAIEAPDVAVRCWRSSVLLAEVVASAAYHRPFLSSSQGPANGAERAARFHAFD